MRMHSMIAGLIAWSCCVSGLILPVEAQYSGSMASADGSGQPAGPVLRDPVLPAPPTASVHEGGATTAKPSTTSSSTTTVQQQVTTPTSQATTTVTQTTSTVQQATTPTAQPAATTVKSKKYKRERHRWDFRTARRLAKDHWLDKAVEANPALVEGICSHYTAALILAKHPRLGEVAQWDHYTCRRLTKWKTVARILAKNGECYKVVALDPEGVYRAVRRDKMFAKLLTTNPMYDQMIYDNPDLGRLMATFM
jgi:hypothetical protein